MPPARWARTTRTQPNHDPTHTTPRQPSRFTTSLRDFPPATSPTERTAPPPRPRRHLITRPSRRSSPQLPALILRRRPRHRQFRRLPGLPHRPQHPPQFGHVSTSTRNTHSTQLRPRVVALSTTAPLAWTMRHTRTLRSTNHSRLRCTHRGLRSLNVRASRGGLFAFG